MGGKGKEKNGKLRGEEKGRGTPAIRTWAVAINLIMPTNFHFNPITGMSTVKVITNQNKECAYPCE